MTTRVHGYYGTYNRPEIKPTDGVHYMMLDEHIIGQVDKAKDIFEKDMKKLLDDFAKQNKQRLDTQAKEMRSIRQLMVELKQFIAKIVEVNELKMSIDENTN